MRLLLAILVLAVISPLSAQPGSHLWLQSAAGELGYQRCAGLLAEVAGEGITGQPVAKNLESAQSLTDKHVLGGFVASRAGDQVRHHTLAVVENQNFLCEGRLVTSYVESSDCRSFSDEYLADAEFLGEIEAGRTRVYHNPPFQLYLTATASGAACLVTGIRRFGTTDPRSECAYRDVGRLSTELCLLYRGRKAPVLTLKLANQPVFTLREDLTSRFELTHPLAGNKEEESGVISGRCRAAKPSGKICSLSWAGTELYKDVHLGDGKDE